MGTAISGDQLGSLVERIERLEAEKADLAEDIKQVYAEAKGAGYDPKAVRQIIRERKIDPDDRRNFAAILDLYRDALGMGPLFEAARDKPASMRSTATDRAAPAPVPL